MRGTAVGGLGMVEPGSVLGRRVREEGSGGVRVGLPVRRLRTRWIGTPTLLDLLVLLIPLFLRRSHSEPTPPLPSPLSHVVLEVAVVIILYEVIPLVLFWSRKI